MNREQFEENFEVCDSSGAWLFTTTGCFNRHNRKRAEQELTLRENKVVSFDYYRSDDMQDSILISYVAELQELGHKIVEPTLEEYVLNHRYEVDMTDSYKDYLKEVVFN